MRYVYDELFGFRREFDEIFNRILGGKPWAELPAVPPFKKAFNFTPAVEAYVDKEGKKYVCRVTLSGIEPKEGVIVEKLTVEYANGVLEITAPITVAALPRKIEIKTTAPSVKQVAA